MDQPAGADVRCSAVVFRGQEVLLVRRVREGGDESGSARGDAASG